VDSIFGTPEEIEARAREAVELLAAAQEQKADTQAAELAAGSAELDRLAAEALDGMSRLAGGFLDAWSPEWTGPVFAEQDRLSGGTETESWQSADSRWSNINFGPEKAFSFGLRVRVEIRGEYAGVRDAQGMVLNLGVDVESRRLWLPGYPGDPVGPALSVASIRESLEGALTKTGKWDYISDKQEGFILEYFAKKMCDRTVSFDFGMLENDMREALAAAATAALAHEEG